MIFKGNEYKNEKHTRLSVTIIVDYLCRISMEFYQIPVDIVFKYR